MAIGTYLRAVLAQEYSREVWKNICDHMLGLEGPVLHVALDYVSGHTQDWPAELCTAPPYLTNRVRTREDERFLDPRWQMVRRLELTNSRIDNHTLEALAQSPYLEHIQELRLDVNQITDVAALARFSALQELNLNLNHIGEVSPLAGLTELKKLQLYGNCISDVGPLAGLTALQKLTLSKNQINDVTPLAKLTALQEIYLDQNRSCTSLVGINRVTKNRSR